MGSVFFDLAPPQNKGINNEGLWKSNGKRSWLDEIQKKVEIEWRANPTGGNENQNGMPSTTSTEDNNKVQTMGGRRNVGEENAQWESVK